MRRDRQGSQDTCRSFFLDKTGIEMKVFPGIFSASDHILDYLRKTRRTPWNRSFLPGRKRRGSRSGIWTITFFTAVNGTRASDKKAHLFPKRGADLTKNKNRGLTSGRGSYIIGQKSRRKTGMVRFSAMDMAMMCMMDMRMFCCADRAGVAFAD